MASQATRASCYLCNDDAESCRARPLARPGSCCQGTRSCRAKAPAAAHAWLRLESVTHLGEAANTGCGRPRCSCKEAAVVKRAVNGRLVATCCEPIYTCTLEYQLQVLNIRCLCGIVMYSGGESNSTQETGPSAALQLVSEEEKAAAEELKDQANQCFKGSNEFVVPVFVRVLVCLQ
jgi:hypothetical protein